MEYKTLKYSLDDRGIAKITLNRPEAMNALSSELFSEILPLLDEVGKDENVRAVVIKGEGRAFCAGGDLAEMKKGYGGNSGFYRFMEQANRFTATLAELPKPVIAAVNGAATGAGMNIVLAADIAVASEKVKFSEIFGNVGLVPDVGGTYLLPRIVGRNKAKEIIMTYRMITAREALELGIVNKVVAEEELDEAVDSIAARVAAGPTFAFALGKKIVNRSFETDINTALSMESMAQALAGNSEDHKEGVAAFFEKRKPEFKGR